jgi:hypothetical protein
MMVKHPTIQISRSANLASVSIVFMVCSGLTSRLTYRRRGGRWRADKIAKFFQCAERKARAAVRCRRFVNRHRKTPIC